MMVHQDIENGIDGKKAGGNSVRSFCLLYGLRVGESVELWTFANLEQSSPPQRSLAESSTRVPSSIARTSEAHN